MFMLHVCFTDYCRLSGMEGFNCISEELCIPEDYVCDGIPDCVQASTVFDEMNCLPPPPDFFSFFLLDPLAGNSVHTQCYV